MEKELLFTPAELSDMLGISKSTLLRWEREGLLTPPRRDFSDQRQQRLYGAEHLRAIAEIQRRALRKEYAYVGLDKTWDERAAGDVLESLALLKFLQGGDVGRTGLKELRRHERLRPKTIRILYRVADRYELGDEEWCDILTVVLEQGAKLRKQNPDQRPTSNDEVPDLSLAFPLR